MLDEFIEKWGLRLGEVKGRGGRWEVRLLAATRTFRSSVTLTIYLPNKPDFFNTINYMVELCRKLEESSRQSSIPEMAVKQENLSQRQNLINLLGFDGYTEFLAAAGGSCR